MKLTRHEGNGRYHKAIRINETIYLSGITATDAGEDISSQSRAVLELTEQLLLKYGSRKENILHADIYIRDMEMVTAFNACWDDWVVEGYEPTRACMVSSLGRQDILVEVVIVAVASDVIL